MTPTRRAGAGTALWLYKTEPSEFSWADLVKKGRTTWDGISNNQALIYLRQAQAGDRVLVYHTGSVKAIVGLARVTRGAYPDPKKKDERLVVVDLEPVRPLREPVTLTRIKAAPGLAAFPLVRISRLSIMPVAPAESTHLLALAGETGW
jgi:predicted RNA-binding protein with PUA-like domain